MESCPLVAALLNDMDIAAILKWLEDTSLATAIRDGLFWFPLVETIHVIALAMVFGTIIIVDLRLLGLASAQRSFKRVHGDIVKWTWAGFAVTILTGALMFITNAGVYYNNFWFRSKMVVLALAGINAAVFELTAGRRVHEWEKARSAPGASRYVAALSIVLWIGVIIAGRMIGFTTSRAKVGAPVTSEPAGLEDLFEASPFDTGPGDSTAPPSDGKP